MAVPLDPPQRLEVDGPHDLGRHQPPPILGRQRVLRALVEIARAAAFERYQLPDRFGDDPGGEVVHCTSMRPQVVERQVDAPPLEIGLDVAQDVGQLQRDAEVERVVGRPRAATAEDPEADHPDRRCHPAAVFEQIVERLIARRVEIHRDAVDHILERLARQIELTDKRLQAAPLCRGGFPAVEGARQLVAPERDRGAACRQRLSARRRRRRLVNGVVHGPAEVPDDSNRFAPLGREDQKGVIEVGVARHQDFPSSVAAAKAGRSRFPIVGRLCSVSYSSASTLLRIRNPPAHVARSS